jgi:hypothetical protein
MPTTLPVHLSTTTADEFPLRTMVAIAFLGIAAGLWSGAADETRWLSPSANHADAASPSDRLAAEAAVAPLSGLRFAP